MRTGTEFPTDIASSSEVKAFSAGLEKLRIKLLFGTSSVYIPVLSPEDAQALLLLNETPTMGTLLVSEGLSERIEDAESLDYSKVEVSTVLKGLSGVMVASPLPGGMLLTYGTTGEAEKIRRSLLSSQTEMILDNLTFEKSYKQETQFMKLITEIIIYLQFFVVMVIGVVTVIRTISARRSRNIYQKHNWTERKRDSTDVFNRDRCGDTVSGVSGMSCRPDSLVDLEIGILSGYLYLYTCKHADRAQSRLHGFLDTHGRFLDRQVLYEPGRPDSDNREVAK
jgi:hypothetical protein